MLDVGEERKEALQHLLHCPASKLLAKRKAVLERLMPSCSAIANPNINFMSLTKKDLRLRLAAASAPRPDSCWSQTLSCSIFVPFTRLTIRRYIKTNNASIPSLYFSISIPDIFKHQATQQLSEVSLHPHLLQLSINNTNPLNHVLYILRREERLPATMWSQKQSIIRYQLLLQVIQLFKIRKALR